LGSSSSRTFTLILDASSASATFNSTMHLDGFVINGGVAELSSGGSKVLALNSLSIASSGGVYQGRLDLTDNDLIAYGGNLTVLTNYIRAGRNGGGWDGMGILTSEWSVHRPGHLQEQRRSQ